MNRVTHFNYSLPMAYAKRRYWLFGWWRRDRGKWGVRLLGLEYDSGGWWKSPKKEKPNKRGLPMTGNEKPCSFEFRQEKPSEPFLTITPDRRVIVHGDIYDAAKDFWKLVAQLAPSPFTLERGE